MTNKIIKLLCVFSFSISIFNYHFSKNYLLNPEITNYNAQYLLVKENTSEVEESTNNQYIEIILVFILSAGIGALIAYLLFKKKTK